MKSMTPSERLNVLVCYGGSIKSEPTGRTTIVGGKNHLHFLNKTDTMLSFIQKVATSFNLPQTNLCLKYIFPELDEIVEVANDMGLTGLIDIFQPLGGTCKVLVVEEEVHQLANPSQPVMNRHRLGQPCMSDNQLSQPSMSDNRVSEPRMIDNRMDLNEQTSQSQGASQASVMTRSHIWENNITGIGQEFEDRFAFRTALKQYAIAHNFTLHFIRNATDRVSATCKADGCTWMVHTLLDAASGYFIVKNFVATHTCGGGTGRPYSSHASKDFLSDLIVDRLRNSPNYRASEIKKDMEREYGVNINYQKAWMIKEEAVSVIYGNYKDSYNDLPWYCNKLTTTNPDSRVVFEVAPDRRFRRCFISLHASIVGFTHCRPLLFLDGSPLVGRAMGFLLVAIAVDGRDHMFPLAYAVVDTENNENWSWFLCELRFVVSNERQITFVSNRDKNLHSSIMSIFPEAFHAFCVMHLEHNLREGGLKGPIREGSRASIAKMIHKVARASDPKTHMDAFLELQSVSEEAYKWVLDNKPEHWCNSLFQGNRYNHLTSDIVVSFNNWVLQEREFAIVRLLDGIRIKMMAKMHEARKASEKWEKTYLIPEINEKLNDIIQQSQLLTITNVNDQVFEVKDHQICVVNLADRTCTCRQWQISGLPCKHACAAITSTGGAPSEFCCGSYWTTECYHNTYRLTIYPVTTEDKPTRRNVSDKEALVLPPTKRRKGRPKKVCID